MEYSIVIPTYNKLHDCLKPCIESIIKNTDMESVELVIVSNGCVDGTVAYLDNLDVPHKKILKFENPLGYTVATNTGIKNASGKFIILLNNDNVILDFAQKNEWIAQLRKPFDMHSQVAITGPAKSFHGPTKTQFMIFFCVMIRREIFTELGYLDEIFNPGYGEDIDFARRAQDAGYTIVQVPHDAQVSNENTREYSTGFPIYHKSSQTVHKVDKWEEIVQRNENILIEKYVNKKYKKDNSMPKFSIVIPTYNHLNDCLKPCIESIQKYTNMHDVEVIVVANGCVDGTCDYVRGLGSNFVLIERREQLGYTKATNLGMRAARGEYVVLLNNDVILLEQNKNAWLDLLSEPFRHDITVGMTGPMLFRGKHGTSNDFIMFFCAMTTREVINKVGYLDEIYTPGGVEDVDYGLRLTIAGYKLVSVPDVDSINRNPYLSVGPFPIYHPGGTTCSKEKSWNEVLLRNNNILKRKYPKYFHGLDWIEEMSKSKPKKLQGDKKACIVVLATGDYSKYVKNLVDSINVYFMPEIYKEVLILSDAFATQKQSLGDRCVVVNRICKPVTKATYFFELLLENSDIVSNSDYCFKMDADMLVHTQIEASDILPCDMQNFTAVQHFSHEQKSIAKVRPKNYSANIPEDKQNCPYWQSCIFGGRTTNMMYMAEELNAMIQKDRDAKSMWGAWEEPYLNFYFAHRSAQVRTLSPAYASPLLWHQMLQEYRKSYQDSTSMPVQIFHYNHHHEIGKHPLG